MFSGPGLRWRVLYVRFVLRLRLLVANKKKRDEDWAEAKRRCGLNQDDIRMAKELGLNPRSLIKNIPSKTQRWKAPVKYWIRDLYQKHQSKVAARRASKPAKPSPATSASRILEANPPDADLIFDDDSVPANFDFLDDDDSLPF